jgi:hypothetical protein
MSHLKEMEIFYDYEDDGDALVEGLLGHQSLQRLYITNSEFVYQVLLGLIPTIPLLRTLELEMTETFRYFDEPQLAIQGHAQLLYMNLPLLEITFLFIDFSALETHRVFCHAARE